jgi:hypothetical protein
MTVGSLLFSEDVWSFALGFARPCRYDSGASDRGRRGQKCKTSKEIVMFALVLWMLLLQFLGVSQVWVY